MTYFARFPAFAAAMLEFLACPPPVPLFEDTSGRGDLWTTLVEHVFCGDAAVAANLVGFMEVTYADDLNCFKDVE